MCAGFSCVLPGRSKRWIRLAVLVLGLTTSSAAAAVQEGEVTLADGSDATVRYRKVFEAPPRLTIVEFRRSWFKEKPYSKDDFVLVQQDASGFRVLNAHPEQGTGATATIKWRAEGTLAAVQPPPPAAASLAIQHGTWTPEQVAAAVQTMKGNVVYDPAVPGPVKPVIGVDLHHVRVSDAELEPLRVLTKLRTLNLCGTGVTDAGMKTVGGLLTLQTLHLNETRVGDAGLQELRRLGELKELSLYHTQVTDEGLASLQGLTNLRDLTLSGPHITDRGLMYLTRLRNLRHLFLSGTGATKAGVQELKKALPKTDIVQ
jgi:hypothetical protein